MTKKNGLENRLCAFVSALLLYTSSSVFSQPGGFSSSEEAPSEIVEAEMQIHSESFEVPEEKKASSAQQRRLTEATGKLRYESNSSTGNAYFITAKNLAKMEKSILKGKDDKALKELAKALSKNEEVFGKLKGYDFRIVDYQESKISGDKLVFRQYVQDVPAPLSEILLTNEGLVKAIRLFVVNPENSAFLKSTWLSDDVLQQLAVAAWEGKYGGLDSKADTAEYTILFDEDSEVFVPAYEAQFGSSRVHLNAVTGEIIRVVSDVSAERQCERNSGVGAPSTNGDCDQLLSGVAQYTIFKANGNCVVSGHSGCTNSTYTELISAITGTRNWLNSQSSSAPAGYDAIFNALPAGSIGVTGAWYHRPAGTETISFTTTAVGKGKTRRDDIAGHETGHMWHHSRNNSYLPIAYSSNFGVSFIESIADIVRSFSTGNYVQYTTNSAFDRHLNPSPDLSWSSYGGTVSSRYDDSIILSNLFIDIRSAVGTAKGNKIALWMGERANSNWDGAGGYAIGDFREALSECITNTSECGLSTSQRNAVCNLWDSRSFPGALCPPPPIPGKPSWINAVNTGQCGYSWDSSQGAWLYGSRYYFNWNNVSNEDYYSFCNSAGAFGPYVCTNTYGKNVTTTYPQLFVVASNTWFAAIKACNSSGCSALTGVGFQNTCNQN